ncbi:Peptidyl-prolyl cis-trans isomerase A (PPIase A) (Rotamase A) [Durusdinium trenchii]|uniref:Peptidyl-prolyl cis-trans isomerase A (PPIase A) (Rotamase A) n=1 Tax=Durusdinium trenchii TaxID=1381693 RepID=A0ABP0JGF4_9DINO
MAEPRRRRRSSRVGGGLGGGVTRLRRKAKLEVVRRRRVACALAVAVAVPGGVVVGVVEGVDAGVRGEGADGEEFFVNLEVKHFATGSKGSVLLKVVPEWSPLGARQFKKLVEAEFYDQACFFRVIKGFMAQVGIPADPSSSARWKSPIKDDPRTQASNKRGYVSFATAGRNTRTFQFFVNFGDNSNLDAQGFTPFAVVEQGMDVVDKLYVTGEGAPRGRGPSQGKIQQHGNEYLKKNFPDLSCIEHARLVHMPTAEVRTHLKTLPTIESGGDGGDLLVLTDESDPYVGNMSVFLFVVAVFAVVFGCFRSCKSGRLGNRDLEA